MNTRQKRNVFRIVISAITAIILSFLPVTGILRLILFFIPYVICGHDIIADSFYNIIHGKLFDEKFLMFIATMGAFAIGEYTEAVMVTVFYQTGELFQSIAAGKARRSISDLMEICPETATVIRDGKEIVVSPEEVEPGEIITVRPGEKIPLDGEIVKGSALINTSALTGESIPVEKSEGDKVISGTINQNGAIAIKTESRYEDSTVSKILELVESSSDKKSKTEKFITRFAHFYTPCVVISALFLALVPPLLFNGIWSNWLRRALVFLMVSCPCALVISVPLSFFGSIGRLSKKGILIKGANHLEALASVKAVVFDKTGTLTKGNLKVEGIYPSEGTSEKELLLLGMALENHSTHPAARAVCEESKKRFPDHMILNAENIEEKAGRGIKAVINGQVCLAGNSLFLKEHGIEGNIPSETLGAVHISKGEKYLGYILAEDEVKENSRKAVDTLKALGIPNIIMLTGDTEKAARKTADETGISEYHASLLPKDKVDILESIMEKHGTTAFAGDGINDAPVLMRSDVGIAMGALGSDAAIEAADIVITDDDPLKIAEALRISAKTAGIVRENIAFSLGAKLLFLILGSLGLVGIWGAVFGDVGVMILAVLNSMRCMKL